MAWTEVGWGEGQKKKAWAILLPGLLTPWFLDFTGFPQPQL